MQLYRGLLLLLQSDTVVPGVRMMNESPCNRSSWLILSLQQTKSLLYTVATSVPQCVLQPMSEEATKFLSINLLKQEIISNCLSQLLILSHHGICLEKNLETPGRSICCLRVHLSDNMCGLNAAPLHACFCVGKEEHIRGSPYIFAIIPTPNSLQKKNENKAARHPQGSA